MWLCVYMCYGNLWLCVTVCDSVAVPRSIFSIFARTAFTGESETSMHHFWEMIAYIANTLIFMLSGVVIAESILEDVGYITGGSSALVE